MLTLHCVHRFVGRKKKALDFRRMLYVCMYAADCGYSPYCSISSGCCDSASIERWERYSGVGHAERYGL